MYCSLSALLLFIIFLFSLNDWYFYSGNGWFNHVLGLFCFLFSFNFCLNNCWFWLFRNGGGFFFLFLFLKSLWQVIGGWRFVAFFRTDLELEGFIYYLLLLNTIHELVNFKLGRVFKQSKEHFLFQLGILSLKQTYNLVEYNFFALILMGGHLVL